ncbi:hypothetical protein MUN88_06975 [Gracilibacillus caseinilyticus]|uniref:Uncharacterized protein n=1 Tax=Gracilibacillus caseinilyticus TaxID=2932256 RepID=A0ABY4EZI1_9BACI|nr:hypothetical protein [Gracilibacillus caseinilyticus]UOQ49810.1 hypothetical protein MUN88_06975 [Gracilibacillus caseinilyticus]
MNGRAWHYWSGHIEGRLFWVEISIGQYVIELKSNCPNEALDKGDCAGRVYFEAGGVSYEAKDLLKLSIILMPIYFMGFSIIPFVAGLVYHYRKRRIATR